MRNQLQEFRNISRDGRLLVLESLFVYIGVGVFQVIFNLYLVRLGFREDFIGAFQAVNVFGIGLMAIPAGMLCNRSGFRNALTIGIIVLTIASILQVILVNPVFLLIVGFIGGAGLAMVAVPQPPFLAEVSTERERPHLFSMNFAVVSLATTIGSLAGGQIPAVANTVLPAVASGSIDSFRFTLVAGAAIGGLGLAPLLLLGSKGRETVGLSKSAVIASDPVGETQARSNIIVLTGAVALMGLGSAFIVPFYNVYLSEVLNTPTQQVGYIFALANIFAAGASLASPAIYRRMGKVNSLAWIRLATLPGFLLVAFFPSLWLAVAAYILRMMFMSMSWPMDTSLIMESVTMRLRATTVSFRSAAWNTCWALASFLAGYLILMYGYGLMFIMAVVFVLAGVIWQFVHFRSVREAQPAPIPLLAPVRSDEETQASN